MNASPHFLSNVSLISTEEATVTWEQLFEREKWKLVKMMKKHPFVDLEIPIENFEEIFKDFVVPFVKKLNGASRIKSQPFWHMKSLVIRFFKYLDGLLVTLMNTERDLKSKDDPIYLPIKSKSKEIVNNLTLMAMVWSFGAILGADLRRLFQDLFFQYKRKFDLKLSSHAGKSAKGSLFDISYDMERLEWDLIAERVEYKIRMHFDPTRQHIIVPSLEISQGFMFFDTLMNSKSYHILFEGKRATQKSTVLS